MANRIQHRRGNGQFRRSSLGDFGLDCPICPACGRCHPYKAGIEPKPERCAECNASLNPELHRLENRKAALEQQAAMLKSSGMTEPEIDRLIGWERGEVQADIDFIHNGSPF